GGDGPTILRTKDCGAFGGACANLNRRSTRTREGRYPCITVVLHSLSACCGCESAARLTEECIHFHLRHSRLRAPPRSGGTQAGGGPSRHADTSRQPTRPTSLRGGFATGGACRLCGWALPPITVHLPRT